jgi:hypothetical protein
MSFAGCKDIPGSGATRFGATLEGTSNAANGSITDGAIIM